MWASQPSSVVPYDCHFHKHLHVRELSIWAKLQVSLQKEIVDGFAVNHYSIIIYGQHYTHLDVPNHCSAAMNAQTQLVLQVQTIISGWFRSPEMIDRQNMFAD